MKTIHQRDIQQLQNLNPKTWPDAHLRRVIAYVQSMQWASAHVPIEWVTRPTTAEGWDEAFQEIQVELQNALEYLRAEEFSRVPSVSAWGWMLPSETHAPIRY